MVGAAIAAAGSYLGMHILVTFGRNVAQAATSAVSGPLPTGFQPALILINFFIGVFSAPEKIFAPPNWLEFDPYAFATALVVGGMVLAGINPGQVLVGFGQIIEGIGEVIPG